MKQTTHLEGRRFYYGWVIVGLGMLPMAYWFGLRTSFSAHRWRRSLNSISSTVGWLESGSLVSVLLLSRSSSPTGLKEKEGLPMGLQVSAWASALSYSFLFSNT